MRATVSDGGRPEGLDELVPLLYNELRSAARRQLNARRRSGDSTPTLETTALVNEAYLKLSGQSRASWRDRPHFLALAAIAMRHILVDRARARNSGKRGGARPVAPLCEDAIGLDDEARVLVDIDEALQALERLNPRLSHVVQCRFFGGLSEEETADALAVTTRTVRRDWMKARMLLRAALEA